MPLLLEALIEETSTSNRWAAERLAEEARMFDAPTGAAPEKLRQAVVAYMSVAVEYGVNRVRQLEGLWRSGLSQVRTQATDAESLRVFQLLLAAFESALKLIQTILRERPKIAAVLRTEDEWAARTAELERAEQRLLELAADAKKTLLHRTAAREPSDPERLEQGLRLAREGKTLSADEARGRYRRPRE